MDFRNSTLISFCIFLLSCSSNVFVLKGIHLELPTQNAKTAEVDEKYLEEDICTFADGNTMVSMDPYDEDHYVVLSPSEKTDQETRYEIPSWHLSFAIPLDHSEMIPYWLEKGNESKLVIDDLPEEACIPDKVADVATASFRFGRVRALSVDEQRSSPLGMDEFSKVYKLHLLYMPLDVFGEEPFIFYTFQDVIAGMPYSIYFLPYDGVLYSASLCTECEGNLAQEILTSFRTL